MTSIEAAEVATHRRPTCRRPAYVMIKPSWFARLALEQRRTQFGIAKRYGQDRLHSTVMPLGDARFLSDEMLAVIDAIFAEMSAEPFHVSFDRLHCNALHGGKGLRAFRVFQAALAAALSNAGLILPEYRFRPHVTLDYGDAPDRTVSIPPIGWYVDEVLLVVSHYGKARHEVLRNWPLIPRQLTLSVCDPDPARLTGRCAQCGTCFDFAQHERCVGRGLS